MSAAVSPPMPPPTMIAFMLSDPNASLCQWLKSLHQQASCATAKSFKSKYFMFVISDDLSHACADTQQRSRRMRAAVLGGGPGGLNFAITLKLRDPSHDVVVIERNRPNDTFGWGVVLSDETLGNLH